MQRHLLKYIQSQRKSAWMGLAAGALTILVIGLLYYWRSIAMMRGFIWSGIPFILAYFSVSSYILFRAQLKQSAHIQRLEDYPREFYQKEIPQSQWRINLFHSLRRLFIPMILVGVTFVLGAIWGRWSDFVQGIGFGLILGGVACLYLNIVAEWYTGLYNLQLKRAEQQYERQQQSTTSNI